MDINIEFIEIEAGRLMKMYNLIREMKKKSLNPPSKGEADRQGMLKPKKNNEYYI